MSEANQTEKKRPNVMRLEAEIAKKDYEAACRELLAILGKFDSNFGGIQEIECNFPQQLNGLEEERAVYLCTRLANAITALFTDPNLVISESGAKSFLVLQRWISLIFAIRFY